MNKARERVKKEIENGEGISTHSNPSLLWRIRTYVEITLYWTMIFGFPLSIVIWIITGDFWKGLAFLALCQFYNFSQNFRGLVLHLEHLIEWTIQKTI